VGVHVSRGQAREVNNSFPLEHAGIPPGSLPKQMRGCSAYWTELTLNYTYISCH